ncbi:MAG: arginase [Gammaproteobacteria bacterium]|nr:arginase [Gammaproteobacteria bacterium]
MSKTVALIGFASGVAANNPDCALGPWYLYYHPQLLQQLSTPVFWHAMIKTTSLTHGTDVLPLIEESLIELSQAVFTCVQEKQAFCVIGGDHSSAMGTWSAVAHAYRGDGDIGLIWIDAHMDSHTPETTHSHNMHGMPLAHLLGQGVENLCQILDEHPKLLPQNICLIGIHAYEEEEHEFLKQRGVKIYFMEEVQVRGVDVVLTEACDIVRANTCGFGVSIDLDAINPKDAPGVGYREAGGMNGKALQDALRVMPHKEEILGFEITELNPIRDEKGKTAELLVDLMQAMYD